MNYREYKRKLKKEYKDTFTSREMKISRFHFKLRYIFIGAFSLLLFALLIQHFYIYGYNRQVNKHNQTINEEQVDFEKSTDFSKINSKLEYEKTITNYLNFKTIKASKKSILSKIFTLQPLACSSKSIDEFVPPTSDSNNSTQTNVQVQGIDEADVAKSDGKYIYYFYNKALYIYDIQLESNIQCYSDSGVELYIYQNTIITLGNNRTTIYEWNQDSLGIKFKFDYAFYLDSRLMDEHLYLTVGDSLKEEKIKYESCYYDTCSNPYNIYTIYKINLHSMNYKEVQLISAPQTILYASNQNFYFASNEKYYTSISIFNIELEPIGVVHVEGKILNQFSMDEYENHFRIVSTDLRKNAEELNAISIFDISSNLDRIGYLNQGIGKERQTVRSVRFDQNKCYVVTYEVKDPLYEIDCSNPKEPKIVSAYEAPGYSNYLHTFKIKDKEYVLGLGFTDSRLCTKISVYEKKDSQTIQLGKDFILTENSYWGKGDYSNSQLMLSMFENHKTLFFYQDTSYLYLGAQVAYNAYVIFKIDIEEEQNVVTIYKEINSTHELFKDARAFLVNGKLYITYCDKVIVEEFYSDR